MLLAEARNLQHELVAGLEEDARIARHADPGGRARRDHVAGHQRHVCADIAHELGHAENHGDGVSRLHPLAVEIEAQIEALRIGDFVRGDEPGSQRTEAVMALRLDPFAGTAFLQAAFGHVVADAIAGHIVERGSRARHSAPPCR